MDSVLFTQKENIAILTLNRPEKLNSFTLEMGKLFQDYLDECNSKDDVKCVIINANGKAFCAGQDLQEAIGDNAPEIDYIVRTTYNPIINKIRNLRKPVIAMVQGVAAGAGANIAFASDIVVAGKSASFIQAFSKIGLIPDSGGTYFLPRLVGGKAMALMLTGDKITADEASNMNLIWKVFEDELLLDNTLNIAEKLSKLSPTGLRLTKELVNQSFNNSLEVQLNLEEKYQKEAGNSDEYIAGVNAFLNKGK